MRGREFSLLAERLLVASQVTLIHGLSNTKQKLFTVETEEKQEVTGEKSA
jgi:hypothetical protein